MHATSRKAKEIFVAALKLAPDQWDGYLAEACGADDELSTRVRNLLQANAAAGSFLEPPVPGPVATVEEPIREGPGTVIGPYKLLEQIGEGGFGLVFLAEQQQPVRRKVALKILKPGMDTRQVIARFEAERQALALMDHPNIARVLDAGETASGRPHFVMELVKGVPITDYCDQKRLSTHARLELFVSVCQAVQHAHHKGIIHRDLKPSNVLVALHDDVPVVKVIDFGIAKALGQQLTDKTLVTGFAQMVGTLMYMSPEQAGMSGLDIDTRSDIYSLGVLLYELLTGTTPFDKERLRAAGYDEMRRIIREEEPARPSTRLSTLGQAAATQSAQRQSDPQRLSLLLRGELDWIVMKALDKDRTRRYETANELARDVERHLHDEPVRACPPSASYRLRKFVRRNQRTLVTGTLMGVLLLVALAAVTGSLVWLAIDRGHRQHETERGVLEASARAEAYLGEGDKQIDDPVRLQMTVALAEGAVRRAEGLLATGEATPQLTERLRGVRDAVSAARRDSDLLVAVERIQMEKTAVREGNFDFAGAAPRYAALLRDYGVDLAAPAAAAARVQSSRLRGPLLAALEDWRRVTKNAAQQQQLEAVLQAAEPTADAFRQRWLAAVRQRDGPVLAELAGAPAVQTLPVLAILNLARDLQNARQAPAAVRLLRGAQERSPGNFWLNHELGMALRNLKPPRTEEAVRYLTAALALRSNSPGVYLNLGLSLHDTKDLDGAIRAYQAALQIDPNYAMAHNNLGWTLLAKNDLTGAIREFQAALKIDPNLAMAHNNLGVALHEKKDFDGAIREFQIALKIDPNFALAHTNLASAQRAQLVQPMGIGRQFDLRGPTLDGKMFDLKELRGKVVLIDFWATWCAPCVAEMPNVKSVHDRYHEEGFEVVGISLDTSREALLQFLKAKEIPWPQLFFDDPGAQGWKNPLAQKYGINSIPATILVDRSGKVAAFDVRGEALAPTVARLLGTTPAAYDKQIALDPKKASAWSQRAFHYTDLKQWDKAIADYSKAIELDAKNAWLWRQRASCYAALYHWDKAIADCGKVIEFKPGDVTAWRLRAAYYANLKQWDKAIADCTKVIKLEPRNAVDRRLRASYYANLGQRDKALADYDIAIELEPKNIWGWCQRGAVYANMQQGDKALADYDKAIELEPKNVVVWRFRCNYHVNRKQWNKALADCTKLIELEPKNEAGWRQRASYHANLKQWDQALADLGKAIEANPKSPFAWGTRGSYYAGLTQWDKALADYEKVIELNPKNQWGWRLRGSYYANLKEWDKAAADYSKSIELDPRYALMWRDRASFYVNLKQWDKALADYEKAIELEPNSPVAHERLAWLLATCADSKVRDPRRAIAAAKRAVNLSPNDGSYQRTLAWAEYRAGNWQAAVTALHKKCEEHSAVLAPVATGSCLPWPKVSSAITIKRAGNTTGLSSGCRRTRPRMRNFCASAPRLRLCCRSTRANDMTGDGPPLIRRL